MNTQHTFLLRVPIAIWNKLQALAKRSRRSVNQEILVAIEHHLDRNPPKEDDE